MKTKRFGEIPDLSDEEEARIQAGIDADPDNPELTVEEITGMRPFAEVFPELAESIRRARGRPPEAAPKRQVTVRLDADVIEALKKDGAGWQTRMNATLRKELRLDRVDTSIAATPVGQGAKRRKAS
ncbi:MAG: hypothetical protein JWQ89_3522 [Devosia sp.]|uniref:BrnA antitoxin family protein n=1 Tax=Devosia sp. TaxID=1871048 RepID=UPI0026020E7F|nr:BrnA antitoxin family protein [Devosia sp.]MDB5541795.1 hypothetical protein [Devosia sp.]